MVQCFVIIVVIQEEQLQLFTNFVENADVSNSVYLELLGDHVILVIYINGLYWSLIGFSVVDPTVGGYGIYRGESKTSATHVPKRPQHRHKLLAAGFLAIRPIHRSSEVKTLTKEECLTIPESMHNFVTSRNTFLQLHVHMYLHPAARTGKIHKGGNQSLPPKIIYCFFLNTLLYKQVFALKLFLMC